jgi:Barstar (barnase inhibitor)
LIESQPDECFRTRTTNDDSSNMLHKALGEAFEYIGAADIKSTEDALVLLLPERMNTPRDLFSVYAKIGQFPGYFGHNWDALLDS